jgi:hypothetical protein
VKIIKKDENGWQLEEYLEYLRKIRDRLPPNARNFAFCQGHYDIEDNKSPYDSWVECVNIREQSEGARHEIRTLEIRTRFLSAAQEGFFEITYKNVQQYFLSLEKAARFSATIGHGYWVIDELLINPAGFVSHEIEFSDSGRWKITCADIIYKWLPKPN